MVLHIRQLQEACITQELRFLKVWHWHGRHEDPCLRVPASLDREAPGEEFCQQHWSRNYHYYGLYNGQLLTSLEWHQLPQRLDWIDCSAHGLENTTNNSPPLRNLCRATFAWIHSLTFSENLALSGSVFTLSGRTWTTYALMKINK